MLDILVSELSPSTLRYCVREFEEISRVESGKEGISHEYLSARVVRRVSRCYEGYVSQRLSITAQAYDSITRGKISKAAIASHSDMSILPNTLVLNIIELGHSHVRDERGLMETCNSNTMMAGAPWLDPVPTLLIYLSSARDNEG